MSTTGVGEIRGSSLPSFRLFNGFPSGGNLQFQRKLDRSTTKLWARCELIGLDLVASGGIAAAAGDGPRLGARTMPPSSGFFGLNVDVRARPAWTHLHAEGALSRQKFVFRNQAPYHPRYQELLAALLTDRQANALS